METSAKNFFHELLKISMRKEKKKKIVAWLNMKGNLFKYYFLFRIDRFLVYENVSINFFQFFFFI